MKKIFLTAITAILFFYGCKKNNDSTYFNGEIIIVDMPKKAEHVTGEIITLDDIYTGSFYVYDSLIVFNSTQFPDQLLSVFNLHTKKQVGYFCNKGNGPDEFYNVSVCNFVIDNNHLRLWLYAFNEQKMLLLNITESINSQTTQYDSIYTLDWRKNYIYPFNWIFDMNEQTILAKCPSNVVFVKYDAYYASNYYLFNPFTADTIRSYIIHNRPVINEMIEAIAPIIHLGSIDQIKPDKRKIAMGMWVISQINILDLETGKLLGLRNKNTPDYSYLEEYPLNLREYYFRLCVDNDYIYGLYANIILDIDSDVPWDISTNEIHIFDWEGNFVKRVILDHKINEIAVDLANRILYGYNSNTLEEELYAYDIRNMLQ